MEAPQPSEDVDGVPLDDVYFSTAVEGGYPSSYGTNTATTYPQNYGNYYYGNTQGQYSIPNTEGSVTKTKINLPYGLDPSKLQPSTMEAISDEKIKSFTLGTMKKSPFQKQKEHTEAKKKFEEDEAKRVYEDFVNSFEKQDAPSTKTFLRGETIYSDNPEEAGESNKKKEYKLQSNLNSSKKNVDDHRNKDFQPIKMDKKAPPPSSSASNKKRSIDELKEEMKNRQDKGKFMKFGFSNGPISQQSNKPDVLKNALEEDEEESAVICVKNLAPHIIESLLWKDFGKYGAIISIEIKPDGPNKMALINFTERSEAQNAIKHLQGKEIFGKSMKIGFDTSEAKSEKVSQEPVQKQNIVQKPPVNPPILPNPPNPQGQMNTPSLTPPPPQVFPPPPVAHITVVVPSNQEHLQIINKLATFVARHGIQFERMIMTREDKNPKFAFLFEVNSLENIYYRWRTYSLLQGDSENTWRQAPFQMYFGGPMWVPPSRSLPQTTTVTTTHTPTTHTPTKNNSNFNDVNSKNKLSNEMRDIFEDMLRDLTTERQKIKEAMGFALDHAHLSGEVVQIITESLILPETPIPTKLARLFLVSDVLHNSQAPVPLASSFRTAFETKLPIIFQNLNQTMKGITGRITAQNLKDQILKLLRLWNHWSLYSDNFINQLQSVFLNNTSMASTENNEEDVDGVPI